MNYAKVYNLIISNAKSRGLDKNKHEGYFECHHIIPKCFNGSNDESNLVLLTGREHYLCHWLLWKSNIDNKSLFLAYHKMVYQKREYQERNFKVTSRQYEILKRVNSERMHNRVVTDETKLLMSSSALSHKGIKNNFYGKKHSEQTKAKMKLAHANRSIEEQHIRLERMSKSLKGRVGPNKGKTFSNEHRMKLSAAQKLRWEK